MYFLNPFITSQLHFLCVLRTLKITFSKFQVYNTVSLNIVTVLYIKSQGIIHPITESLCPLTNVSPLLPPLAPGIGLDILEADLSLNSISPRPEKNGLKAN